MQKKSLAKKPNIRHINQSHYLSYGIGGITFFCIDQISKQFALTHPEVTWYLISPWIGFEVFFNPGVAFGIPIPNILIITITPLLIIWCIYTLRTYTNNLHIKGALFILCAGALSNFIDRVWYSITIDYIRIGTSIINIGDILIVVGATILIYQHIMHYKKGGICSSQSIPPLLSD